MRVHGFQVRDARGGRSAVVMEADEIGRLGRHEGHELLEPALAVVVIGDGRPDEFLAVVLAQGYHLVVPGLGGALGGDVVLVGLVEEVDDGRGAGEDVLPVLARELRFEVDHWAVGGAVLQFGRGPGVPVADGGEGAVEVGLVHGPGDAGVAGAGAVGPVPEEAALFDDHGCFGCRVGILGRLWFRGMRLGAGAKGDCEGLDLFQHIVKGEVWAL